MADASRILEVILQFKENNISAGTSKALQSFKNMSQQGGAALQGLFGKVFNLKNAITGLAAALGAREFWHAIEGVGELGEQLLKMSRTTGLSVDFLSKLRYVAQQTGTDFDGLAKALRTSGKVLGEMQLTGSGPAELNLLGPAFLAAAKAGKSLEELLPLIVDGFNRLGNEQLKTLVASKLFGKGYAEILPILNEGGAGIAKLQNEASKLGVVWTKLDALAGEHFVRSIKRVGSAMEGLVQNTLKPLLPTFTDWLEKLENFITVANIGWGLMKDSWPKTPTKEEENLARTHNELLQARQELKDMQESFGRDIGFYTLADEEPIIEKVKKARQAQARALEAYYASTPDPAKALAKSAGKQSALNMNPKKGDGGFEEDAYQRSLLTEKYNQQNREKKIREMELDTATPGFGKDSWQDVRIALKELRNEWTDTFLQIKNGLMELGHSMVTNITDNLVAAETGTKNWSAAFKDATKSILTDILKIIQQMVIMRIVGGLLGAAFPAAAGTSSVTVSGGRVRTAASGTPRTEGLTIAGEAGYEAIIPLPDGRHVPVMLSGAGGGTTIHNYITVHAIDAKSFNDRWRQGLVQNQQLVGQVHSGAFQSSAGLRQKYQ